DSPTGASASTSRARAPLPPGSSGGRCPPPNDPAIPIEGEPMTDNRRYEIVAYPNGARQVVGTVTGRSIADQVARRQARDREEFVDVEHDGERIAIFDDRGAI